MFFRSPLHPTFTIDEVMLLTSSINKYHLQVVNPMG